MTLPLEQIADIRAACIKANPEIACPGCGGLGYTVVSGHGCDGTDADCQRTCPVPEQQQCNCQEREIRLADVLIVVRNAAQEYERITGYTNRQDDCCAVMGYWLLFKDDLTQQSPKCISFVHSLLV